MGHKLGINTGFAVNRYSCPSDWGKIVGDLGLKYVQLTADLLNPSLTDKIIDLECKKINEQKKIYHFEICSLFTGAFTRVNHLAHPNKSIQRYWIDWFKRLVDISNKLECNTIGSHFGIFTHSDNSDVAKRLERRKENIQNWHEIGAYAKSEGLEYITWEPMSISREQGETLAEAKKLQVDVNKDSPIPFYICLDVDHGDLSSSNPNDTDPYAWLAHFADCSPQIHLKQSSENKSGHWPFTKENNEKGRINHRKVIDTLIKHGNIDSYLLLELSFREREPFDSTVIDALQESVAYWRQEVTE